jgi:ATP-dependent exoDNAse (exonuclease V) beta subunit
LGKLADYLEHDTETIAEGVHRLVRSPKATPVLDKTTNSVRPVEPGDVAVLVATNNKTANLAGALARRGVRAAVARAGLWATPKGTLITAALRWLVDSGDELARAEHLFPKLR